MRRTGKSSGSVASPTITSFSPDTNIVGDGFTDSNILTIDGTAVANSTVSIYDGTTLIGTAITDANGLWSFTTGILLDGIHSFTATDSVSGATSASSNVETITVDTVVPAPPAIVSANTIGIDQEVFSGTAEANSTVTVYDGSVKLGTANVTSTGAWSFTSGILPTGVQTFTAIAMDAAGNISAPSHPIQQTIGAVHVTAAEIPEPAPAASADYNKLVFDDEFTSLSTIDMSNSQAPGFNWYLASWFTHGSSAADPSNFSISNGVLKIGGGTGSLGYGLVSAFDNSTGGYTGNVFGNGGYFEASIRYDPNDSASATTCGPAFWSIAVEHLIDNSASGAGQWLGQPVGYAHFVEVDFMEPMIPVGQPYTGSQSYQGNIHDWYGTWDSAIGQWANNISNRGNDVFSVGSIDWNAFHTYGLQWVPQSGNTPGHVTWYFDGQAMASIYWLGPPTSPPLPGQDGQQLTPSSPDQATTTYSILDSQHLALSLATDTNWPMYVDWVRVWQEGSSSASVPAPIISFFSPDSGIIGDGITNSKTVTLNGTAEANSSELIYDGTTWLGSATANAGGGWTFTTGTLADGTHSFTAIAVDTAGSTSASSAALTVKVDTVAPTVTEALAHDTGSSSADTITSNDTVSGTSDPNAVVQFAVDGTAVIATVTADASGAWTFSPTGLADGTHTIVASETDVAGNTGSASLTFMLDTTAPTVAISNETFTGGKVTLAGTTPEAGDLISVYDGTTLLGTTTSGSGGAWTFTTGTVSNAVHTYTATATDVAGNVGQSSNDAILASSNGNTLVGTGHDFMMSTGSNTTFMGGGGGNVMTAASSGDAFIFKAITDSTPTNADTIVNFDHVHDIIQFSGISGINATNGIPTFQGQLGGSGNVSLQAHSIAYIETGGNTEVLVNTTSTSETVTTLDTHAANMEIVLAGTHLGLTSSNFHLV